NSLVHRINIEKGRAASVVVETAGQMRTVFAEREVVISAGAIKSPHLLMLSGVGPADLLRSHGIEVVHDSPNVGKNYQNHPYYPVSFICSSSVSAQRYAHPGHAAWAGLRYLLNRRGAFSESLFPVGGFIRTEASLDVPDIQVVLTP